MNTGKMFTLRVDFLTASLLRIPSLMVLFLYLGLAVGEHHRYVLSLSRSAGQSVSSLSLLNPSSEFAVNQALSAIAVHNSLIPIKKTERTLYFCYSFAQLEQLHIAQFADHLLRFVAEWVVDVILLQVGLRCSSMKMIFDPFYKLMNSEMLCFFDNCECQS